jgi:hypothetical protein
MTAFDDAAAAIFADDNQSRPAIYRAGGTGAPLNLRIVFAHPQRDAPFGETGAVVRDITARLRLSDVPVLKRGDTLEIGGVVHRIERVLGDTSAITAFCTLSVV